MRKFSLCLAIFLVFLFLMPFIAHANPVSEYEAKTAAVNWLKENPSPFGEKMGGALREVITYKGGTAGNIARDSALYYRRFARRRVLA